MAATNSNTYWFPAKRYGWGWGLPLTWQGWVVMFLFVAAVAITGALVAGRNWPLYAVLIAIEATAFVAICWWKGEPTRWRWGD